MSEPKPQLHWTTLSQLIVLYGLPVAIRIAGKWFSTDPVTPEELKELEDMANRTPRSVAIDRLRANGVDPESDEGKAFLSLFSDVPGLPGI